jgi:glycosyltransferase involved in cell wall biosynthesis
MPRLHEGVDGVWEHKEHDDGDGCWRLDLPLRVDGELLGELRVSGAPNGQAAPHTDIVVLLELAATCETYLQSVIKNKGTATRGHGVHDKRPRVLFLNRSYWPDAEATGQLLTELCEDLTPKFNVTVIAGRPNANPSGAKYHSYSTEVHRGVRIQRVWHTRFAKGKLPGRLMNYLSFLFGALSEAIFAKRPDIVVVESDPPLLCLIGWLVQMLRGTKLVVYLQDIHPDIAVALGKIRNGVLVRMLRKLMFHTYRRAERVIVLSRDMKDHLVASGVPAEKVAIIPNWIDTKKVRPVKQDNPFRKCQGINGDFVVMYSGNLGLCQRLEDVVAAANHLRDRSDILFLLIGGGALKAGLEKQVADLGLENVRFLPYQPKSQISESLSAADVHLVPLDERVASYLMPSKLYGVLASATPLIAIAPENCELAEMTVEHDVGVLANPGEPESLAQAIAQLADDGWDLPEMGKRSRQLAESEFDRTQVTARFAKMLQELAGMPIRSKSEPQKVPELQTGNAKPVIAHDARV